MAIKDYSSYYSSRDESSNNDNEVKELSYDELFDIFSKINIYFEKLFKKNEKPNMVMVC